MYAARASTAFITRTAEDAATQGTTFVLIMFTAGITRSGSCRACAAGSHNLLRPAPRQSRQGAYPRIPRQAAALRLTPARTSGASGMR